MILYLSKVYDCIYRAIFINGDIDLCVVHNLGTILGYFEPELFHLLANGLCRLNQRAIHILKQLYRIEGKTSFLLYAVLKVSVSSNRRLLSKQSIALLILRCHAFIINDL